jgi:glycosyltransferase involved in cell wall biosynthesis
MNEAKTILIIVPFFTLGGAETQALNIAVAFKEAGHKVLVLGFEKKNGILMEKLDALDLEYKLYFFDLSVLSKGGFNKFIKIFKLAKFVRSLKVDYLFPFTYFPNLLISIIWRFTKAKKCFWNQRGLETLSVSRLERLAKLMGPNYIANSNVCAEFIAKRHSIDVSRVAVIRNGVNKDNIKVDSSWRELAELTKDKLVFSMVANFYPEKKHVNMLQAWLKATGNAENKLLIFIGYSPQDIHLLRAKAMAFDLGIKNVLFLASSDDIGNLLKLTDVGVLISESEGCPNSVLECMQHGLPVVASDIPAILEVFNSENPLLKHFNDIDGLASSIELCFSEEYRAELGAKNQTLVNARYGMNELSSNYLKLV